jgi:hypothetical protein
MYAAFVQPAEREQRLKVAAIHGLGALTLLSGEDDIARHRN